MSHPTQPTWVVITGGSSGIGRILVQHFSRDYHVLTCGRRRSALEDTRRASPRPDHVTVIQADLALQQDRQKFADALPVDAALALLVQNAAVGDPGELQDIDVKHLDYSWQVNVVAPMVLVQLFRTHLARAKGRVLHMGTSVAHHPQKGTLTYGVTKMAFYRLYQQLNLEGIICGSLSPGLVDTEGLRDHIAKARAGNLPHVDYFDKTFAAHDGQVTLPQQLVQFIVELMQLDDMAFASKEWRFRDWQQAQQSQ